MKLSIAQLTSTLTQYVSENKVSLATFNATRENTVGLLDTIGKIFTITTNFVDKLAMFDGEDLSNGKIVEEWASDLILPQDYDPTGADALAPHDSTYRPVYFSYTLGRKYIPQTIRNNDIERAVHNEEQFVSIVADKTKKMYDSEIMLKYGIKREVFGVLAAMCMSCMNSSDADATYATLSTTINQNHAVNDHLYCTGNTTNYGVVKAIKSSDNLTVQGAIDGGYIIAYDLVSTLAKPVDTPTGEAFIKQLKTDVEIASDYSEGHSLNLNTLGATNQDGLVLVLKQGIMPSIEVDVQAGAFHGDKVAIPTKVVVVPNLGSADAKVWGVLIDARGMKLHNTYRAVRENVNGKGDFLNMFFHTENTAFVSRNVFVKVYKSA